MPGRPPLSLTYHGLADVSLARDPHSLFTSPRALRRQIRVLRRWGYELVTFGALADRAAAGTATGCASLTFDDGFADNLHELVPLLREEAAPATVFVVSGWLGRAHPDAPDARVLSIPELRELRRAGVEVGAHTVTHPVLTDLPYGEALRELRESRLRLEDTLEQRVDLAAYPFGAADAAVRRACREAGYRAAAQIDGHGSWDDPFALPRQNMGNASSITGLRLKRADRFERAVRREPWRTLRRHRRRALVALGPLDPARRAP